MIRPWNVAALSLSLASLTAAHAEAGLEEHSPARLAPWQSLEVGAVRADEELETLGARIGAVEVHIDDVFEQTNSLSAPYRLANGLHISTRPAAVRAQMLFGPGDPYSRRTLEETARALRASGYLSNASVEPVRYNEAAGYFVSAIVLTVGIVGLLKAVTNIDCPWDLTAFGGRHPYLDLFSARPDDLPRARCFPAAHASSGYAFMALYFLAYERSRKLARFGLAAGLLLGLIFGVAQQSRGAHFISHDLWSALFGWMIPLTLYAFAFDQRLYARLEPRLPLVPSIGVLWRY
jgi:hypothetical protein